MWISLEPLIGLAVDSEVPPPVAELRKGDPGVSQLMVLFACAKRLRLSVKAGLLLRLRGGESAVPKDEDDEATRDARTLAI